VLALNANILILNSNFILAMEKLSIFQLVNHFYLNPQKVFDKHVLSLAMFFTQLNCIGGLN